MSGNRGLFLTVRVLCIFCAVASAACAADVKTDEDARRVAQQIAATGVRFDLEGAHNYARYAWHAALREDPDCQLARWRLGYVRSGKRWLSTSELASESATSPKLAAYQRRRSNASDAGQQELALAQWCQKNSLDDRATVHFRRVLDNASAAETLRNIAMRALGLQPFGDQLMTEAEITEMRRLLENARHDLDHWLPKIRQIAKRIEKGRPKSRSEALRQLREIDDPSAIPAIELALSSQTQRLASEAVGMLAVMPHPDASSSLARHAVVAQWETVRHEAAVQLRKRDLHEFVPTLIEGLQSPIRSVFQITPGPEGRILHEHTFFQEGAEENRLLTVKSEAVATDIQEDSTNRGELRRVQQRAQQLQQNVARQNAAALDQNERIYQVLREVTGKQELVSSPSVWWDWWKNYNEFEVSLTKPIRTLSQEFSYAYVPRQARCECFPAGTLVWSESGKVAIETIRAGDRVLSQNPQSGELGFKVVRGLTRREQAPMQTLTVSSIRLTLTTGHPLWVNGQGWRMAKRLELGDSVHTMRGSQRIERLALAGSARAYNLIVDGFGSYFVTELGVLAHDNTYRAPTRAISPGLLARN